MKIDRILLSEGVVGFEKKLVMAWFVPLWEELCRFSFAREITSRTRFTVWHRWFDFSTGKFEFYFAFVRRKCSLITDWGDSCGFRADHSRRSVAIRGESERAKNWQVSCNRNFWRSKNVRMFVHYLRVSLFRFIFLEPTCICHRTACFYWLCEKLLGKC